jgi:NAD(P)-dependent dehydrogenase (short-subunit alcohol dehydrogenase family)
VRLAGQRAVVTGGSRGIGLEIARLFREEGAQVLAVSRMQKSLDAAAAQVPGLHTLAADVSDLAGTEAVSAWVGEHWGALDILINNAGIWAGPGADVLSGRDEDFTRVLAVNVVGPYRCVRALLPWLERTRSPRIINVGSRSGLFTPNLTSAYGVSKAALHALTIATANELRGRVAVNALSPGWVKTDMAPDGPGDPRWSAACALHLATRPAHVTGLLFHDKRVLSWSSRTDPNA